MTGIKHDTPRYIAIKAIIESEAGRLAAQAAADRGQPALCGVDAILTEIIVDYGLTDEVQAAGQLVKAVMLNLGYKAGPQSQCSPKCTAKSGVLWLPPVK